MKGDPSGTKFRGLDTLQTQLTTRADTPRSNPSFHPAENISVVKASVKICSVFPMLPLQGRPKTLAEHLKGNASRDLESFF